MGTLTGLFKYLNFNVNKTGLHCFPVVFFGVSRRLRPF